MFFYLNLGSISPPNEQMISVKIIHQKLFHIKHPLYFPDIAYDNPLNINATKDPLYGSEG